VKTDDDICGVIVVDTDECADVSIWVSSVEVDAMEDEANTFRFLYDTFGLLILWYAWIQLAAIMCMQLTTLYT